ncbi:MAG: hypothetical protein C4521_04440 [Actinobacteria bacterium]|nr:MAG: hypothetical protein C4521_04440 [Actinomycetota bacterium]
MQTARKINDKKKATKAPARRLAVVRGEPKRKTAARRAPFSCAASFYKSMVIVAALSALAMVNLSQRVLIVENGLAIAELQRKIQVERTEKQRLEMSLLVLQSPGRIQRQAIGKLKMVQPNEVSYMQVRLKPAVRKPLQIASVSSNGSGRREEGILLTLLEKVAGQVQLLPLGNLGTPIE